MTMFVNMNGFNIIIVLLVSICVPWCSSMSEQEIEEFQNFLKTTSVLDQVSKDGFNSDEDEGGKEEISDDAWEQSGKFEGDLILSERQQRLIVEDVAEGLSRNGLQDITKRWPNNEVIYYIQKDHFSGSQVEAIQDGINDLGQSSCIKFRPYKKGDRDAVVIQGSRRGCFSQVGYQGGYQILNLSGRHPVGRGCFRHGTVVHELLHTLGFYHMQSSPDRDDYIDVVWENIIEPAKHNFRKYNSFAVSDFGVGYDYESVLHYGKRAFSSNGKDTLVPKKGGAQIGQRVALSDKDVTKLNKMYCDKDSNNFDANEDKEIKITQKKKKSKNKPFSGHGIGYHQGKTVVINLPAAETYQLPDLRSYNSYDYYVKPPNILSENVYDEYLKKQDSPLKEKDISEERAFIKPLDTDKNVPKDSISSMKDPNIIITPNIDDKKFEVSYKDNNPYDYFNNNYWNPTESDIYQYSQETTSKPVKTEDFDLKLDENLKDALHRFEKIIKVHIYPSKISEISRQNKQNKEAFYDIKRNYNKEPGMRDQNLYASKTQEIDFGEKNSYPSELRLQKKPEQIQRDTLFQSDDDSINIYNDYNNKDNGEFEKNLEESLASVISNSYSKRNKPKVQNYLSANKAFSYETPNYEEPNRPYYIHYNDRLPLQKRKYVNDNNKLTPFYSTQYLKSQVYRPYSY